MPRPRLLPVAIAGCALLAPLYLLEGATGLQALAQATAEGAEIRPPARVTEPGFTDMLAPPTPASGLPAAPLPTAAAPPEVRAPGLPPAGLTGSCDANLLALVAAEREQMAAQARELEVRGQYLMALEQRAREQLDRLATAQAALEAAMAEREALSKADLGRLVAIYENMKPKDAARHLEQADAPVVLDIVSTMPERRSAPILAEMAPDKVQALTHEMARRRLLSGDRAVPEPAGM